MSSVSIAGNTSGSIILAVPDVAGANTATIPARTGNLTMDGPAFSVIMSTNQTISSGVNTKIAFNLEQFDTNNCYDTTLYRFTPNIAGYYFINLNFWVGGSTSFTRYNGKIFKNGSEFFRTNDLLGGYGTTGGSLIYLNGTTDYVEPYCNITASTALVEANVVVNVFQGFMVRGA